MFDYNDIYLLEIDPDGIVTVALIVELYNLGNTQYIEFFDSNRDHIRGITEINALNNGIIEAHDRERKTLRFTPITKGLYDVHIRHRMDIQTPVKDIYELMDLFHQPLGVYDPDTNPMIPERLKRG